MNESRFSKLTNKTKVYITTTGSPVGSRAMYLLMYRIGEFNCSAVWVRKLRHYSEYTQCIERGSLFLLIQLLERRCSVTPHFSPQAFSWAAAAKNPSVSVPLSSSKNTTLISSSTSSTTCSPSTNNQSWSSKKLRRISTRDQTTCNGWFLPFSLSLVFLFFLPNLQYYHF